MPPGTGKSACGVRVVYLRAATDARNAMLISEALCNACTLVPVLMAVNKHLEASDT